MVGWSEYWEEMGKLNTDNLFLLSDYNIGLSYLPEEGRDFLIKDITKRMMLSKKDNLIDVGCGCGLFTQEISELVKTTVGLDASYSMLSRIKDKNIKLIHSEATKIPFKDGHFDKVLCHSIFQYFPNISYAKRVINEMIRVCKRDGIIYILDILDEDTKSEYLVLKKKESPDLKRFFYKKDFFKKILPNSEVFSRLVPGYGNSKYRFNVLFVKKN